MRRRSPASDLAEDSARTCAEVYRVIHRRNEKNPAQLPCRNARQAAHELSCEMAHQAAMRFFHLPRIQVVPHLKFKKVSRRLSVKPMANPLLLPPPVLSGHLLVKRGSAMSRRNLSFGNVYSLVNRSFALVALHQATVNEMCFTSRRVLRAFSTAPVLDSRYERHE